MSQSNQHKWRLYSKNCQNPPERSLSSSQSLDHQNSSKHSIFSNHCNSSINNNNNNSNNNKYETSTTRSSSSSTTRGSSCHPYNSFGSKLGLVLFSYQQQCFVHLQSLFTKSHFFNNLIVSPCCCSCFTTFHSHDHIVPSSSSTTTIRGGLESDRFMATPAEDFSPAESIIRKNKLSGQLKREELEREVSMLQNMLNQEEKVHQVLELVHNQHNGSSITIPNFLPPKMKELLAELAMVEGEIARLEAQINQLKLGLKHEQENNKESKAKQWRYGSPIRSVCNPSSFSFPTPVHNSVQNERIGYETKSLHFISKAIKGDYNVREFSTNPSDRRGNLKEFGDQKENFFHEEKMQEKVPKKSGILKHSSPMRDPRNPSPKPMRSPGISSDIPPKPVSMTINSEENIQNWHPNKLSEEIMKCLNFIYIRLLRTTRAMELEKSGPITRSLHPSLSSRSFRVEAGSNSKESRQQDPYGIFNVEECLPRDIGPYKNLVIFTASSMDPKCISSPSSVPLLRKLRLLMNNLQTVELKSLTYQQKLAFWINMYNACIMHGFLQYGVPSTPEKLLTLMNKAILNIGGNIINAQAIEHYILRKSAPSSMNEAYKKGEKEDKEAIVRELYGLEATEPNVTFALCCGTHSSPAVRMYTAESVAAELERSKLEYLQASVIVTSSKRIAFPELLIRNTLDFAADKELLVEWVCHQLPTSGTLRKSIVDCFRASHNSGKIASAVVEKIAYDYEFQYILAI